MPIVRIELFPGRTSAQKAKFAKEVTRLSVEILGCSKESVDVLFVEVDRQDWVHAGEPYASPAEAQR